MNSGSCLQMYTLWFQRCGVGPGAPAMGIRHPTQHRQPSIKLFSFWADGNHCAAMA